MYPGQTDQIIVIASELGMEKSDLDKLFKAYLKYDAVRIKMGGNSQAGEINIKDFFLLNQITSDDFAQHMSDSLFFGNKTGMVNFEGNMNKFWFLSFVHKCTKLFFLFMCCPCLFLIFLLLEFMIIIWHLVTFSEKKLASFAFRMFDTDNDNILEPSEVKAMMQTICGMIPLLSLFPCM